MQMFRGGEGREKDWTMQITGMGGKKKDNAIRRCREGRRKDKDNSDERYGEERLKDMNNAEERCGSRASNFFACLCSVNTVHWSALRFQG